MALATDFRPLVTTRVDDVTLKTLTNPDSSTQDPSPSIDNDRLDACIEDAIGEFTVRSGFEPLITDPSHVGAVSIGTVAYLYSYKLNRVDEAEVMMKRFIGKCLSIRDIATSSPGTTNTGENALTRSAEAPNGRIVRPDSDRANFRKYLPGNRQNLGSICSGF